jgi:hypothetical protein
VLTKSHWRMTGKDFYHIESCDISGIGSLTMIHADRYSDSVLPARFVAESPLEGRDSDARSPV